MEKNGTKTLKNNMLLFIYLFIMINDKKYIVWKTIITSVKCTSNEDLLIKSNLGNLRYMGY